jgi:hypothetical protein
MEVVTLSSPMATHVRIDTLPLSPIFPAKRRLMRKTTDGLEPATFGATIRMNSNWNSALLS